MRRVLKNAHVSGEEIAALLDAMFGFEMGNRTATT
jgi:hypothetical protein